MKNILKKIGGFLIFIQLMPNTPEKRKAAWCSCMHGDDECSNEIWEMTGFRYKTDGWEADYKTTCKVCGHVWSAHRFFIDNRTWPKGFTVGSRSESEARAKAEKLVHNTKARRV